IHFVGSKSFSSHAKWTAKPAGSNCWMGAAPLFPAVRFFQKVSASFPSGVTAPTPVTTTRLRPFMLTLILSLHASAAVDEQYLAGYERGLVRAEKAYRTRYVIRLAETAQRRGREDELTPLIGDDVGERGLDVAGRDDVHAPPTGAELAGERFRHPDDPRLRRGVVRLARVPVQADDRRHVHDRL